MALTTVNKGSGNASILYENSDGTFQPASNTNGSRPYASVAADFNGDGRPDLAVANSDLSTVSVFLNAGNGNWQPSHDLVTGVAGKAIAIAAGDFNHDGRMDLVIVNRPFSYGLPGNSVSILLGNGDGTFQIPAVYPVGLNPNGVAVGDFNRDGNLDIAVADSGSVDTNTDVAVLLGKGDGSFKPASFFAAGNDPESIATADLNGDGKLDLVVDGYYANYLMTLLGNGDGTFRPPIIGAGGDSEVLSATLADMNHDGKVDAILAGYGSLELAFGKGDGTFTDAGFVDGSTGYAKSWEASVAEVDVDGDSIPDYVTADPYVDQVTVYINKGNGASYPGVGIPVTGIPTGGSPQWLSMADFNGDGRPDIAVSDSLSGDIGLMLNIGSGTKPSPSPSPTPSPSPSPSASATPSPAAGSSRAPVPQQVPVPFRPRGPLLGASQSPALGNTATTFYFGEGFTAPGFDDVLSLFVPKGSGRATIDYYLSGGRRQSQTVPLVAGRVRTVDVGSVVAASQVISIKVTLPAPGIADRSMHFNPGRWYGSVAYFVVVLLLVTLFLGWTSLQRRRQWTLRN